MEEPFTLQPEKQKVIWIVWGAQLFGLVMCSAAFAFVMRMARGPIDKDPAIIQVLLMVTVGLTLMSIVGIFLVIPRIMLQPKKDAEAQQRQYFTYCSMRWVMSASISLCGLMYHFVGGHNLTYLGFVGVSVLLFLINAPTQRDLKSYARAVAK